MPISEDLTIRLFKETAKDGPVSTDESLADTNNVLTNASINSFSNRGNKLFDQSTGKNFRRLNDQESRLDVEVVSYANTEARLVIGNKKRKLAKLIRENYEDDVDAWSDDSNEEDPLKSVDLVSILRPIQDPSELVTRKPISNVYTSEHLCNLGKETIEFIEREQDTVIQMSKLISMFLGDDYRNLLPDNLKLPKYDHHLTDGLVESVENSEVLEDEEPEKPVMPVNPEEAASDIKAEFEDRRMTRAQSTTQVASGPIQIDDPFFDLPQFKPDPDFGVDPKDADETRQLLEIALQRNEEYIRSLKVIRSGFVRADRLKNTIYKWCQEMNGDIESP